MLSAVADRPFSNSERREQRIADVYNAATLVIPPRGQELLRNLLSSPTDLKTFFEQDTFMAFHQIHALVEHGDAEQHMLAAELMAKGQPLDLYKTLVQKRYEMERVPMKDVKGHPLTKPPYIENHETLNNIFRLGLNIVEKMQPDARSKMLAGEDNHFFKDLFIYRHLAIAPAVGRMNPAAKTHILTNSLVIPDMVDDAAAQKAVHIIKAEEPESQRTILTNPRNLEALFTGVWQFNEKQNTYSGHDGAPRSIVRLFDDMDTSLREEILLNQEYNTLGLMVVAERDAAILRYMTEMDSDTCRRALKRLEEQVSIGLYLNENNTSTTYRALMESRAPKTKDALARLEESCRPVFQCTLDF